MTYIHTCLVFVAIFELLGVLRVTVHVRLIEYVKGRCCVVIFARMNPKICKNGWNERPMDSFTFTYIFVIKIIE